MAAEQALVACVTKEDRPEPPVPSQTTWCSICGISLWVSDVLYESMISTGRGVGACIPCANGIAKTQKDIEYQLGPEQESQLKELGILEDAKAFIAAKNRDR